MKTGILTTLLITVVSVIAALAQEKAEQGKPSQAQVKEIKVEARDDEFSGKRMVTLKELSPGSNLFISLKTKIETKKNSNPMDRFLEYAEVEFVSMTGKREHGAQDNRFDFLVDGNRVEGGEAQSSATTDKMHLDKREVVIGVMDLNRLQKVTNGRRVQMKIGDNIFDLSSEVLAKFREFVSAVRK